MTECWRLGDVSIDEMARLAGYVAVALRPGDVIALSGDLGAGKTAFARMLIRSLAGEGAGEIPSPTFALAQSYEAPRFPVLHIDCYRIATPDEADELGLDESLRDGVAIIEWPERIAAALPQDRLDVRLVDGSTADTRGLTFEGRGRWESRLDRLRAVRAFCEEAGWGKAEITYLQGDASARTYARITDGDRAAILMDSPAMPDGPAIRGGMPYSAIAHLAESVTPFVAVAAALRERGISVPEIFAQDLENGFLVIEDLGDLVFGAAIAGGADERELYLAATDVLVALRRAPPAAAQPVSDTADYALASYDAGALGIEVELLLDWLWPMVLGTPVADGDRAAFLALWTPLFEFVGQLPPGWVLRDYHSPNLIWLPDRDGAARVGVIDFQDAVRGPAAYDLAALGQDARRDISPALEEAVRDHYCAGVGASDPNFDRQRFLTAYAILGAQRNTKILGIFARLARRDGKRAYLQHIPRVSAYLDRNLLHPALADLRGWYEKHLPGDARVRAAAG